MNIVIVTDNLKGQVNGVVKTYKSIEKFAEVTGNHIVYLDPGQFKHISCPGYPEVKLAWPWKFKQKIEALQPDHIHIATEGPLGLMAKLFCEKHSISYTTAYHTRFPEFVKRIYGFGQGLSYRYLRWFHKNSKAVYTPSQSMKDDLIRKGFAKNIVVWTRGVSNDIITERQPIKGNLKPQVLYVGRVSKEKGLDDLCKLQDTYDITVVGDGPYLKNLRQKYNNVIFPGYKFGKQLAKYYASADVFCFPSKTDTFGIVIIEALCNGTPVAGYNVTGPKDIIQLGVTGFYGDNLKDQIEHCMTLNKLKIRKISQEKWSWKKCWDIFYKEISK